MKDLLREEKKERLRLTEEVGRLRMINESLNRKVDQMKPENDHTQILSLHTGMTTQCHVTCFVC